MRLLIKIFLASAPKPSPMSSMTCGTNLRYFSLYPEKEYIAGWIIHYYFRIIGRTPIFLFTNDWSRIEEILVRKMIVEDGKKALVRQCARRPRLKISSGIPEQYSWGSVSISGLVVDGLELMAWSPSNRNNRSYRQYQFKVLTIPLSKVSWGCQFNSFEIFALSTA